LSTASKKKTFITGINGFAGSHLAELLVSQGYLVSGLIFTSDTRAISRVESKLDLHHGDIGDYKRLRDILTEVGPDYIYHLAGQSSVSEAEKDIFRTYEINLLGTLNLLEAVRESGLTARILLVSSGEVYGAVPEERLPVSEDYPLHPLNAYASTKACAELLASQYAAGHGLEIVRVRPFNHIGPGQSDRFVCSSFAKQISEIEKGIRKPVLHVGNLDARRDFTDVRDVVRAYHAVLEGAQRGTVYNVGSHKAWKVGELLKILVGRSTVRRIEIQEQKARIRPNDIPVMLCDPTKLEKEFGWKPTFSIEQTLEDLLECWRRA
jgi:GDP-4-dehydro-6-deoxy-D-mannose reductase